MRFKNVSIKGLAYVDAPHVITSAALEDKLAPAIKKFGLRPQIIQELTGIKERRFWDKDVQPSEVATEAGIKAIENAGISKDKIGVLINTSVCKDYIEPSVAALVHGNMELSPDCLNFDIGDACMGFLDAMTVVGNMIEMGQIDYGLIVDGEGSRHIVEKTIERLLTPEATEQTFRESFASLTLGSGSAAMVLCRSDLAPEGHKFNGGHFLAATDHNRLCLGQLDEMKTDAKNLLLAGIQTAIMIKEKITALNAWNADKADEIVIHQVSAMNTKHLAEALQLDMEKMHLIFPEFGNIGPAAVPITLAKSVEAGRIKKGDFVQILGMGSGINCTIMEIIW